MTEMIERVARALYAQSNWNGSNPDAENVKAYFNELNSERKSKYRKQAEAAIRAMKVPTEKMKNALDANDDPGAVGIYQDMIEAALT